MDSDSQLFRAIEDNNYRRFKSIIENNEYFEARDSSGFTLLHRAAQRSNPGFVELLLQQGAWPMSRARYEWTPLHEAAHAGCERTCRVLLDYGAKTESFSDWAETPLIVAVQARKLGAINVLLEYNANPCETNKRGQNALHILAGNEWVSPRDDQIMKRFLKTEINLEAHFSGRTALHYAVINKKFYLAEMLLEHGARTDTYDDECLSPLYYAVSSLDCPMVDLLVKYGANMQMLRKNDTLKYQ